MLKTIEITEDQYLQYLLSDQIGKGSEGVVYKYDKNNVIKIFYNYDLFKVDDINEIVKKTYPSFCFPKAFISFENRKIGYIMPYIKGDLLCNVDCNYEKFIAALLVLRKDIVLAAYNNLELWDIHDENIIYYEDQNISKLTCIDISTWDCEKDTSINIKLNRNLRGLNDTVVGLFQNDQLEDFISQETNLKPLYNMAYSTKDIVSYLNKLKFKLEQYSKKPITTIGDFSRVLRS